MCDVCDLVLESNDVFAVEEGERREVCHKVVSRWHGGYLLL